MKKYLLILFVASFLNVSVEAQRVKNLSGKSGEFEGVVKTVVDENESGAQKQFLDTGGKLIPVFLDGEKFLNATVSIKGRLNDAGVIVPDKIRVLEQPEKTFNAAVSGNRTVLVIPVNYTNDTSQPATVEQLRSLVFTGAYSVNSYYQQASDGQLKLVGRQNVNGDIADWRTIPFTNENCSARTAEYAAAADNLALQQGYNPNLYQSVVYVFPSGNCSQGHATLGSIANQSQTNRVWVSVIFFDMIYNSLHQLFAHELGHNLGLEHASAFRNCPSMLPFENCQGLDAYGDNGDVMGNVSTFSPPASRLFNNYQRLRLGWLKGKTQIFDSPGTYYVRLFSPNHPTKGTTLAQIRLKDPNGNFIGGSIYLEFRRNSPPYDIFDSAELFNRGVAIRVAREDLLTPGLPSFLIDTVPETGAEGARDFRDASLTTERTFTNSYYGINITTESVNPFWGARVKIQLLR